MSIDPNSAAGQVGNVHDNLSKYFSDMSTYLLNGGTCPDFNTYITNMDVSELHRFTGDQQQSSSNFANGAAIESIHHVNSVLREFGLRSKSKVDYYGDATSEASSESQYYSALSDAYTGSLTGNPTPSGSL